MNKVKSFIDYNIRLWLFFMAEQSVNFVLSIKKKSFSC